MNHESSSAPSSESALSQLVEKACEHWDARRGGHRSTGPAADFPALHRALSREVGTQGTTVAKEVGKLLGWPVYDHDSSRRSPRNGFTDKPAGECG